MAWNTKWQMQFKSLRGTTYTVNISEQGWTGGVTQLTPSDQPFTTQEDDDDDIFKPIRAQSGYLRVIDATGNLLESLMPENNTQRLVQLMVGSTIRWQGFLQADAYTQPWLEGKVEIELPLKSVLGALEDVVIENISYERKQIADIFIEAFEALDVMPVNWYIMTDLAPMDFWYTYLNTGIFASQQEVCNEGTTETITQGDTYADAIGKILSLFGLQLREFTTNIYIAQYDTTSILLYAVYYVDNGELTLRSEGNVPTVEDLIADEAIEFRGDDSETSFLQGVRDFAVDLSLNNDDFTVIEMPKTDEDASPTVTVPVTDGGNVVVQPHALRTGEKEGFAFSYYDMKMRVMRPYSIQDMTYTWRNTSNYNNFRIKTAFGSIEAGGNPRFSPPLDSQPDEGGMAVYEEYGIYTGATPVRWAQQADGHTPTLQSGLWIVQQSGQEFEGQVSSPLYSIQAENVAKVGKYLHIKMNCYVFECNNVDGTEALFNDIGDHSMRFCLKWGDKWWNGEAWVDNSFREFSIPFNHANINSNKGDFSDIDLSDGWIIPAPTDSNFDGGDIVLYILAMSTAPIGRPWETAMNRIITNLQVAQVQPTSVTASGRNNNTYRRINPVSKGFRGEKKIDLDLGTINNNNAGYNFIETFNLSTQRYEYVERMPYMQTASTTYNERPELHLLHRMVAQCGVIRRTLIATVQNMLNTFNCLYTYQGKTYYGIHQETDWRDDKASMKFIEVNKP